MLREGEATLAVEPDKPEEECGVFGVYLHPSLAGYHIAGVVLDGLHETNHRGEESAGLCVSNGCHVSLPVKRMGLVRELRKYYKENYIDVNRGHIANGHNRYSSTGRSVIENAGPFRVEAREAELGAIGVAHNGNITNAVELKAELIGQGYLFSSTTDSEVISAFIAYAPGNSWEEKITHALPRLRGSFSLVMLTKDALFAARDTYGIRPLSIAPFEVDGKECYAVSSETAGFHHLPNIDEARVSDVPRGELMKITDQGVVSQRFAPESDEALCGLEVAYLMRPDSRIEGVQLYTIRRRLGEELARQHPIPEEVSMVTYIPESSHPAAKGYSEEISRIQGRYVSYEQTMLKGRYGSVNGTVRGFISPAQSERKNVAQKNYYVFDNISGVHMAVVDDSVIEANTTSGAVAIYKGYTEQLRNRGAATVHLRIVFPQVIGSCPYGTDIDETRFLVAREFHQDIEQIAAYIGADSLEYLLLNQYTGSIRRTLGVEKGLCMGCVTGIYPDGEFSANKLVFEKNIR